MHDPNKNKTVCVIAKVSVWSLRGLLTVIVAAMVAMIIGILIFAIYDSVGRLAEFEWTTLVSLGKALLFFGALGGVIWLLNKWYEWARDYAKNC